MPDRKYDYNLGEKLESGQGGDRQLEHAIFFFLSFFLLFSRCSKLRRGRAADVGGSLGAGATTLFFFFFLPLFRPPFHGGGDGGPPAKTFLSREPRRYTPPPCQLGSAIVGKVAYKGPRTTTDAPVAPERRAEGANCGAN